MDTRVMDVENEVSKEKLMQDLHLVVSDAEELLRATAGQAGEKMSEKVSAARERIQQSLAAAKESLATVQESMITRTRQATKATDEYVQENPWKSVGMAAGAGLVAGMLISRIR